MAESFRRALDARGATKLQDADVAAVDAVIADGAVWDGGSRGDGDGTGAWAETEIVSRWNGLADQAQGASRVKVVEVYADSTHVIGLLEHSAPEGAAGEPIRQVNVFHLNMEGKATDMWSVPTDAAIANALANGKSVEEHPNVAKFRAAEEARARNNFAPDDLGRDRALPASGRPLEQPVGQGPGEPSDEVVAQFKLVQGIDRRDDG